MKVDKLGYLAAAAVGGVDFANSLVERKGQRVAAEPGTLPADLLRLGNVQDDKNILLAMGFEFLGPCEDEPLLQRVKFPEGWKKVRRSGRFSVDIVDHKERVRFSMIYDPFDKEARILGLKHVYAVRFSQVYVEGGGHFLAAEVYKHETLVFATPRVAVMNEDCTFSTDVEKTEEVKDLLREKAEEWVSHFYNDWKNPLAYWD